MGLATTLIDLLLLGDHQIQRDLPKIVDTWIELPERALTSGTQAALYFFMMSHYFVDAHMPCHADARPLARYKSKLHEKWEEYFDGLVAEFPEPEDIGDYEPEDLLESAVTAYALDLPARIPELASDVWDEVIWICRASFAVNCIVASPDEYPLVKSNQDGRVEDSLADLPMPSFRDLFQGREALRDELSHAIVHDSVLAVAMGWKKVWQTVRKLTR
jgi:hypothetical protein